MERDLDVLNRLLVDTFNEILKVEERALKLVSGSSITVNEVHTLDAIGDGDMQTISEVASAMMVTASTMTITINRLEKKGLVERERAGYDRRVVYVRLTERGRTLSYIHRRFHRRMVKAVSELLTPEEVKILSRAMKNLRDFFHEENIRNAQGIVQDDHKI
jgi:DNA-binding MarR family transcriptional regulator